MGAPCEGRREEDGLSLGREVRLQTESPIRGVFLPGGALDRVCLGHMGGGFDLGELRFHGRHPGFTGQIYLGRYSLKSPFPEQAEPFGGRHSMRQAPMADMKSESIRLTVTA